MTEQDELSRLARAITDAEDVLNETNHRDNLAQLAKIDADAERRPFLVSEIETAENALKDARAAFAVYAEKLAREGAVKVEITRTAPADMPELDGHDWTVAETHSHPDGPMVTAVRTAIYSNGLDAHNED
jgi:hypothetical protein